MQPDEVSPLIDITKNNSKGLSIIFSIICIIDIFGVFPVVTLPKAVIDCGFWGILVVLFICSLQIYTATLLGRCWIIAEKLHPNIRQKNRYPYTALAELTCGTFISRIITIILNVTIFVGGIPNLILASQNLELVGLRLSNNNFDLSFCLWIILIGLIVCPLLWLGSPKDMKFICGLSVVVVASVFFLINICLITSNRVDLDNINSEKSLWQSILITYGLLTFQYDIHPSILTIQMDMNDKSKLKYAIIGGFGVIMFSLTTMVVAYKFGNTVVEPSILEILPTTIPLHFAAILIALQLCLTSAISNCALYQHMEDCMDIPRDFNYRRCLLRTTLTLFAILIAESVPRFDLVMALIGGTLTGPIMFIFPSIFYIRIMFLQKSPKQFGELIFCLLIILSGIILTLITTYLNIINGIDYVASAQPCIYNVTSAIVEL